LFINERGKGIHIFDNNDKTNPVPLSFINIPGSFDVAVKGNIMYVDSFVDLVVLDITDPANVQQIVRIENVLNNFEILDLKEKVIQMGDSLCGDCAIAKKPFILKNREEVLKYSSRELSGNESISFHAAFPIVAKEISLGVLCVFTCTDFKPTERSLKLVETLTSQMSLAIENANLYGKISRQVENLENLVKDRTKDLQTKNAELARMNKMFVGREIRMAELKRQIAEK
jgi:GAF domain-containing protein